jgi:hypothetical protein
MRIKVLIFALLLLPSCAVYRRQFDCPPEEGVPCTSVSDLEQMIVETECGPDLFLTAEPVCLPARKRVWMNACYAPDGRWIPAHYVYVD